MKFSIISMLLITSLLLGCSSVTIVPEQVQKGSINSTDNSQTIRSSDIEITARVDESAINSYNLDSTVTAFQIVIKNISDNEISFNDDSYLLVDETGLQYSLLTPEKIRDMLKKDSYYLVPYPYVGFYYLEDYEKTTAYNSFTSSLPYYYDLYPQDIFTKFLSATTIIPGMKVEGLSYFKIDPAEHQKLKLLIYPKGTSKASPPEFSFPFKIVK
ncbi:MAG: hypothetical protein PHN84_08730 [Desulfuromonadaceae bacterium]|nr:hypothetical protein [Desulfuromonadaceae bacterium]MDD2855479.1 hypothetical protein [Desulfuromonadaceae bacterium]